MAIFGSSNWTLSSSESQREHNYFTTKTWFVDWLKEQFLRKWNNTRVDGTRISPVQYVRLRARLAGETSQRLAGERRARRRVIRDLEVGGRLVGAQIRRLLRKDQPGAARRAQNFMPGLATAGPSDKELFDPCAPPAPFASACPGGLARGTTYYWTIRGKTMLADGGGPLNAPAGIGCRAGLELHNGRNRSASRGEPRRCRCLRPRRSGRGHQLWKRRRAHRQEHQRPGVLREAYSEAGYQRRSRPDKRSDCDCSENSQTLGRLARRQRSSQLSTAAWTEAAVTWNNRPTAGSGTWGAVAVSGTIAKWYKIDITTQVQALRTAGKKSVAIALKGMEETLPYATFSARETATAPQLLITP